MEQQFAEAQYEGEWNWLEDDYLVWNRIGVSADRTTPESVASYLRCGGHISDRVLRQFIWQRQCCDPIRQKLNDPGQPSAY